MLYLNFKTAICNWDKNFIRMSENPKIHQMKLLQRINGKQYLLLQVKTIVHRID